MVQPIRCCGVDCVCSKRKVNFVLAMRSKFRTPPTDQDDKGAVGTLELGFCGNKDATRVCPGAAGRGGILRLGCRCRRHCKHATQISTTYCVGRRGCRAVVEKVELAVEKGMPHGSGQLIVYKRLWYKRHLTTLVWCCGALLWLSRRSFATSRILLRWSCSSLFLVFFGCAVVVKV